MTSHFLSVALFLAPALAVPLERLPMALVERAPPPAKRGGVAAGDPQNNPTATTFASAPPLSTYVSGPTIGGSRGGFYGLLFGLLVVLAAVLAGLYCIRRRRRRRRQSRIQRNDAVFPSAKGAGATGLPVLGGKKVWAKHAELDGEDDGVELRGATGDAWASTASVNLTPGAEAYPAHYHDDRFATSGESLALQQPAQPEEDGETLYAPVAGGQAPHSAGISSEKL